MIVYDQPIFTVQSHPGYKEFAAQRYHASQGKVLDDKEVADAASLTSHP